MSFSERPSRGHTRVAPGDEVACPSTFPLSGNPFVAEPGCKPCSRSDGTILDSLEISASSLLISAPVSPLAVSLARTITLTGAHFLTTLLFAALLTALALVAVITAVSVFDVAFFVIDAVHASVAESAQLAV